jgi:hypothetical protein
MLNRYMLVLLALLVSLTVPLPARQLALPPPIAFGPGDVMVSLEPGPVVWYSPNGTLQRVLVPTVIGLGEGMEFDAVGNLYVNRWCNDPSCSSTGNAVEKYNSLGLSEGTAGGNFNCSPHAIDFDSAGNFYVGQAGCNRTILKFVPGATAPVREYTVAEDNHGVWWLDLAPDGCTLFYTSVSADVKRFDVCTNTQLPVFNSGPLPGAFTHEVRVLPDGGVLVANANVITRLNQFGAVTQTYEVLGEAALWAGLDLVGDGTFWAGNYFSSSVHKFNLDDGRLLASFNTGTPANTVVSIRVKK